MKEGGERYGKTEKKRLRCVWSEEE
jgi:hypothetical protein